MVVKEQYAIVDGNRIRYLEDGKGPDVVLIHGLGSQAERWTGVIRHLRKSHHVIAPDLIGFGLSDKPQTDYTPKFFVKFIFDFLEKLGIQSTIMIGSSLGGQIVAESAAAFGNDIIRKLVLISPTGTMRTTNRTLDAYVMAAMYPRDNLIRTAYQMMAGKEKNIDELTITRFRDSMSRPNAKMAFLSTVIGFKHWPAISPRLQSISMPTLVVWGSEDTMIPVKFAEDYVAHLKNCEFVVMEGCGHRPHAEEPEKLGDVILRFLDSPIPARQTMAQ